MPDPVAFIQELFAPVPPYIPTPDEVRKIAADPAAFITDKIERKKFRRKQIAQGTRDKIRDKVLMSIRDNRPLHFTIPFGGYKHFWNPSHPEPDWAELFHFRYLTEYVQPILMAYAPGVILEYISEDLILTRMNNYPADSLTRYADTFRSLIAWYRTIAPHNLDIRFFRVGERYDANGIIGKVEQLLPERRTAFAALPEDAKERELHRSRRAICWKGERDLSEMPEEAKLERTIESRLIELAYYETESLPEYLGDYLWADNHICVCFSFGLSHDNVFEDLTLGSAAGSIVDFWIGRGILERHDTAYVPRIYSRSQYEAAAILETVSIPQPPVPFRNFRTIEIAAFTPA